MIEAIKSTLYNEVLKLVNGDSCNKKVWTDGLLLSLVKLGHLCKYSVCSKSSIPGVDWGEWLYDLCWLEYWENEEEKDPEKKLRGVKNMVLAVESEWGSSDMEIFEDFQKLLVSNAAYKLMIYQDNEAAGKIMVEMIKRYAVTNGIFILAFLNNAECRFDYTIV